MMDERQGPANGAAAVRPRATPHPRARRVLVRALIMLVRRSDGQVLPPGPVAHAGARGLDAAAAHGYVALEAVNRRGKRHLLHPRMARILIVDDEPDVRTVTEVILAAAGHDVVVAANGLEALEAQRRARADLAVIDLFMPDKDGLETIQELGREFPGLKVIAMSGGARFMDCTRYLSTARALGVGAVLQKPFDADTLLGAIGRLLQSPS